MRNEDVIFRLDEIKDCIDEIANNLRIDTSWGSEESKIEEIRSMLYDRFGIEEE